MTRISGQPGRRWVAAAIAAVSVAVAHAHMDTAANLDREAVFVPRPERARLSSLGFRALVSDYYWLLAVQIVGSEHYGVGGRAMLVGRLVDVVTHLDPWVGHPYRFAAVWLVEDEASVRLANRILQRGIAYHPRDWRNRHYLGFNHFYYLNDHARAAEVLEPAIGLERAPAYLGRLVARLRLGDGGLEVAAAFLEQLARETDDEYARAEYLKSLDEIEVERWARGLDRARAEYRRRRGHDLSAVGDLLSGPQPVLRRLPPAHPHFPGFDWVIDAKSGLIVSSFYGRRYELHEDPFKRWSAAAVEPTRSGAI